MKRTTTIGLTVLAVVLAAAACWLTIRADTLASLPPDRTVEVGPAALFDPCANPLGCMMACRAQEAQASNGWALAGAWSNGVQCICIWFKPGETDGAFPVSHASTTSCRYVQRPDTIYDGPDPL